ncbi:MAG TPA: branched-chain-amino-acid transaminase [Dissulfurispiraceae bacterium]|nr:branched-chain-amino-acid transaminase [Dissulfurispiraceae bacterium]
MHVYLNNGVVPAAEARVSVFDHGFLYGDGIYETVRAYDGVVFMIDEHIRRLYRSAGLIGLDIVKSAEEIRLAIYETMQANDLRTAYIRITVSRGPGAIGLDPALCESPTFVVMAQPFKDYPRAYYEEGLRLVISSVRRNLKEALNPRIKSLNFLNNILAKIEAIRADVDEALMLNSDGFLAEGTISNIFFVKDGILCTPSEECGILDGITRTVVIDLAARNRIAVREGEFRPEDIYSASEVFITNSTMEVMPVRRVDDAHYAPGEMSRLLLSEYRKEVAASVGEKKGESPSLWE